MSFLILRDFIFIKECIYTVLWKFMVTYNITESLRLELRYWSFWENLSQIGLSQDRDNNDEDVVIRLHKILNAVLGSCLSLLIKRSETST
jgi:hypothetical protein